MKVIGIDPGYGITGWGVVEMGSARQFKCSGYGVVRTEAQLPLHRRLAVLYDEVFRLLSDFKPECAVVESLYFSSNRTTAGAVYQARGVILLAIAGHDIELMELGPGTIKNAVTGSGRAQKRDVIRMVERLLNLSKISPDDAADALAGAIAGAVARKGMS